MVTAKTKTVEQHLSLLLRNGESYGSLKAGLRHRTCNPEAEIREATPGTGHTDE